MLRYLVSPGPNITLIFCFSTIKLRVDSQYLQKQTLSAAHQLNSFYVDKNKNEEKWECPQYYPLENTMGKIKLER